MRLETKRTLTGKGELGKRNVPVHAVIDEADAHTLSLNLHARDPLSWCGPLALLAVRGQGKRRQRFGILKQPSCCLFQLAFKEIKRGSAQPVPTTPRGSNSQRK